ncbi:MAG: hypothetical protein J2P27_05950 [Actinobacteria bacterium]|nr:hypothetical protein [Actinomycetota bacterium]
MNLKPPVRRAARLKSLVAVGAISLGFAGAGLAAALPASADPSTSYVAVGSDTIQDVMNGFSHTAQAGTFGNYLAVNPVTAAPHEIITPGVTNGSPIGQMNCSYTRPNGSGEGFKALDASLNPGTTLGQLAVPPQPGCIEVSRSSSGPGSVAQNGPGSIDPNGNLIYVPMAEDAVATATGPTTAGQTTTTQCTSVNPNCQNIDPATGLGTVTFTVPTTLIANADMFTKAQLQTLFGSGTEVVAGGVTYWPANGSDAQPPGSQVIDLYIPQAGSGTLSFWATQMNFSAASPPAWDHQTVLTGPAQNVQVEEHDGTAYASDPSGFGPFSIAQWIAQGNGFNERRHTAILHDVDGVAPMTGTSLNPNFPIAREVYNVMPYDAIVNTGDGKFDPVLAKLFAGTSSTMCASVLLIRQYGFATLPSTNPNIPDPCGSTANGLRVQETNTGPS